MPRMTGKLRVDRDSMHRLCLGLSLPRRWMYVNKITYPHCPPNADWIRKALPAAKLIAVRTESRQLTWSVAAEPNANAKTCLSRLQCHDAHATRCLGSA